MAKLMTPANQKGSSSSIKYGQSYKDLQKSFKYDTLTGKKEEVENSSVEEAAKKKKETKLSSKERMKILKDLEKMIGKKKGKK